MSEQVAFQRYQYDIGTDEYRFRAFYRETLIRGMVTAATGPDTVEIVKRQWAYFWQTTCWSHPGFCGRALAIDGSELGWLQKRLVSAEPNAAEILALA